MCTRGCGTEVRDPAARPVGPWPDFNATYEINGTPHEAYRCRDRLAEKLAEQKARATRAEDDHTAAEWEAMAARANDAEAHAAEAERECAAWKAKSREDVRKFLTEHPDLKMRELLDLNGVLEAQRDLARTRAKRLYAALGALHEAAHRAIRAMMLRSELAGVGEEADWRPLLDEIRAWEATADEETRGTEATKP